MKILTKVKDDRNYKQVNDEQLTYTTLKKPDDEDDHLLTVTMNYNTIT